MPAPLDTFPSSRNMQSDSQFSRGGASNLTLGLMAAGASGNGISIDSGVGGANGYSVGSFTHSNGIPMNASRLRRESMAHRDLASSLTNKMSWGGKSVESWVMDDFIMTGTSPFQAYQSPSFHSSSYLPKLEAQFFKDFSCCNVTLPSLHELLKHYEECHASQQMAPLGNETHDTSRQPAPTHQQNNGNHHDLIGQASRGAGVTSPISGMGGLGMSMRQQQLAASQQRQYQLQAQQQRRYGQRESDEGDLNDTEAAGEMDMDTDDLTPPSHAQPHTPRNLQQQPLRLSAPGTPSHVLSSVNTPIMPHATLDLPRHPISLISHNAFSPDSSVPGTPSAMEHSEFAFPHHMQAYGTVQTVNQQQQQQQQQQHQPNMTSEGMFGELCIDEPAKRLYTPGGYSVTAAQMQHLKYSMGGIGPVQGSQNINNGNPPGRVGGVQGLPAGGVEDKPFKCPVVGCEKAYKNQNGLKYHRSHGHTNQILSENGDGTLSIVNPETSTPYPGTLGMEKEKPYKCEVCGKRYKNLNGLKYHRAHSTHGNTPVPVQQQPAVPPSGVVAVAGGIAEEDGMLR